MATKTKILKLYELDNLTAKIVITTISSFIKNFYPHKSVTIKSIKVKMRYVYDRDEFVTNHIDTIYLDTNVERVELKFTIPYNEDLHPATILHTEHKSHYYEKLNSLLSAEFEYAKFYQAIGCDNQYLYKLQWAKPTLKSKIKLWLMSNISNIYSKLVE